MPDCSCRLPHGCPKCNPSRWISDFAAAGGHRGTAKTPMSPILCIEAWLKERYGAPPGDADALVSALVDMGYRIERIVSLDRIEDEAAMQRALDAVDAAMEVY